jgi:hypothetical protein
MIAALILCALAVLAINNRIFTFISGFDPMTYIRIARGILSDGLAGVHVFDGSGMTAPGFPLILAAAIGLFGPFAPYWVNPLIALALLPLLASVLVRAGVPVRQAAVAVPASLLLLISGYHLNAHFLLYPFRELSAFAVSLAGIWLLLAAGNRDTVGWKRASLATAAGVCAMATACIREPSVIGLAGVLVWVLASRNAWRAKAAVLACFLAPFAAALIAYLALTPGHAPNAQWAKWIGQISQLGFASMFSRFADIEPTVRGWLFQEMGWFWSAMTILGAWSLRRNPRALAAFLIPAALLYLFYAFTEAHRRYLLSSLLFAAPVAGCGVGWIAEAAAARLRSGRRWVAAIPHMAAIAGVSVAMVIAIVKLVPAGPRVKKPQIEAAVAAVARATGAAGHANRPSMFMTPCARYAGDLVSSFSAVKTEDINKADTSRLASKPALVLAALNREALFRGGYKAYLGLSAEAIAAHFADLMPANGPDIPSSSFVLGHGFYGVFRTKPWTATNTVCRLELRPASNNAHVVWLDLRSCAFPAAKSVSIPCPDGTVTATVSGRGLQPVFLPASVATGQVALAVSADGPIPAEISAAVQTGDEPAHFGLAAQRSPSVHDWFKRPFRKTSLGDKYAAMFDEDGGRMEIPMPAAGASLDVTISMDVSDSGRSDTAASFKVMHDSAQVAELNFVPGPEESKHSFSMTNVKPGSPLTIDLVSTTPDNRTVWRILHMAIDIRPAGTR